MLNEITGGPDSGSGIAGFAVETFFDFIVDFIVAALLRQFPLLFFGNLLVNLMREGFSQYQKQEFRPVEFDAEMLRDLESLNSMAETLAVTPTSFSLREDSREALEKKVAEQAKEIIKLVEDNNNMLDLLKERDREIKGLKQNKQDTRDTINMVKMLIQEDIDRNYKSELPGTWLRERFWPVLVSLFGRFSVLHEENLNLYLERDNG